MKNKLIFPMALSAAALLLPPAAHAFIVGPYQVDTSTLQLWHFEETAIPFTNAAGGIDLTGMGNGATAGNPSFTGFGNAVSTYDGGPNGIASTNKDAYVSARPLVNGSGDNVTMAYADPVTGAFTMEAILRVDFDPTVNYGAAPAGNGRGGQMQIVTGEDESPGGSNLGRIWQFRLGPIGTISGNSAVVLDFINVHQASGVQSVTFDVPSGADPDAIVSNGWYHVAVTYDGVESGFDNIKFYWTRLDPSRTEARLIGSSSLQFDLSTSSTDFAIGQTGRSSPNGNFVGLIDEVRISSIARPAGGMMFALPQVQILAEPQGQTIAIGQAATLSVVASGEPPLSYQWRKGGTPITGATLNSITFDPAQASDAASYDVVVTNNISSETSQAAALEVRTPLNLRWTGFGTWDTQDFNAIWADIDHGTNTYFRQGDNVRFDDTPMFGTTVDLSGMLWPSSVVVDSQYDYTFTTYGGTGAIVNNSSLTKSGTGTLIIDTDNAFNGPTVVQAGILRVGAGAARGLIGNGPLTNNGTIIFDRTGTITFADTVVSTGDFINTNNGTVRFTGTNQLSQTTDIIVERGSYTFGPAALGNVTNILVKPFGGGAGSTITLLDGAVVAANVHTSISSSNFTDGVNNYDWRASIQGSGAGTNAWHGPLLLSGNNTIFAYANGDDFIVDGPVTGPDFTYQFAMRGGTRGTLRSSVVLPQGGLAKTDGSTWIVDSTGITNQYLYALIVGGTLQNGNNNALYTNAYLRFGNATFDLNGFNQIVTGLTNDFVGGQIINNSTNTNSRFTLNSPESWSFGGVIVDGNGTGVVRNVSLTLAGGSLTLTNAGNTYSGDTTIASGTLALAGAGAIPNSSPIDIAAGATLDLNGRDSGGYAIGAAQILKGSGAFNVSGNLTNGGTIELDLNKTGGVITGDTVQNLGHIEYGGTLKLNLTGEDLALADSFKLFYATSYGGEFGNIIPAIPASGLAWDTSTLATDGTIRVQESTVDTTPTNITAVVVSGGTSLEVSWPSTHTGWTLLGQTNSLSTGLSTTWFPITGSSDTNRVIIPIDPANGTVFYRLVYP